MTKTVHGVVHGKTIELDEYLGISGGQEVEVQVKLVTKNGTWGEGIRCSAGGWNDHPEMGAIMEKIQQDRKLVERSSDIEPE